MEKVGKIVGINLVILLLYMTLIFVWVDSENDPHKGLGYMLISSMFLSIHVLWCMILTANQSGAKEKKERLVAECIGGIISWSFYMYGRW